MPFNWLLASLIVAVFSSTTYFVTSYEVSCDIEESDAYQWGTDAALMVGEIGITSSFDLLVKPERFGHFIGKITEGLLRFFWPLIIGRNYHCFSIHLKEAFVETQKLIGITMSQESIDKRQRRLFGLLETADKIHHWMDIVNNTNIRFYDRKVASNEYYDELEFVYWRANDERPRFIDATSNALGQEQTAEAFVLLKELALLQLGTLSEMINHQRSKNVKAKMEKDFVEDAVFYWKISHKLVEKMVLCLPNDRTIPVRKSLLKQLQPMLELTDKIVVGKNAPNYTKALAYSPIVNNDNVAFRLNDKHLIKYSEVFKDIETDEDYKLCPECGWNLFSFDSLTESKCADRVFTIKKTQRSGTTVPVRTCNTIILTLRQHVHKLNNKHKEDQELAIFVVNVYNDTAKVNQPCHRLVHDRDHVILTPLPQWSKKVPTIDAIIYRGT